MKTVFKFLAIVFFLLITLIILFNVSNKISIETSFLSLKTNVGFLIFICSVLGMMGTIFLGLSLGWFSKVDKGLKKHFENTKLNYEIESDKVKQLEAKIKTLEEALKIATKSNIVNL